MSEPRATPFFSVVTPVYNGGEAFETALAAIGGSSFDDYELIVVDDGSTDASVEIAGRHGAAVLSTAGRQGPAAARNLGARAASGRFLFFVDADCEVHTDTLERAARALAADPALDALFGCYDANPAAKGTVTEFKNLLHRFVHLDGSGEATTFWAGCGAVRRRLFLEAGGFDETRFGRPSIEDIELGYRLTARGAKIRLVGDVQVRHHKRWTLVDLVRTDVFQRGIPWTRLLLEGAGAGRELNLDLRTRAGVALVGLAALAVPAALVEPWGLALAALALLGAALVHLPLYRRFHRARGPLFALRTIPLHLLYLGYSGVAYLVGLGQHLLRRRPARAG